MKFFISIIMAILPSIILVIYFYKKDLYKPEPKKLIIKIFLLGLLSTFPAIILELILFRFEIFFSANNIIKYLFQAFIVSALVEEWIKFKTIQIFIFRNKHFDEVIDGIVYTVTASLGFALMENILYVIDGGLYVAILRAFTAVPLHALASGLMGYYIGKAAFAASIKEKKSLFNKGIFIAVLIHGLYNFIIFMLPYIGFFPVVFLISSLLIITLKKLKTKINIALQANL